MKECWFHARMAQCNELKEMKTGVEMKNGAQMKNKAGMKNEA